MQVRTAQPIATRDKPAADRRAVFVSVDNETGTLDLLIAQQNDKFGQLRCIYIDTSAQDSSGNGCTIQTDIGQTITALANTQGYYPVFVPFVTKLTISSNQAVTLLMLDFDMRPVTWATVLQSGSVPDPLHVIIDNQPIATNATVENWPAVQPVSISGQPVATDATVQNWPAVQPVSISGQPVATDATVQNWPAVQPVSISGQPVATNATVQNWPSQTQIFLATVTASGNTNFLNPGSKNYTNLLSVIVTAIGLSVSSLYQIGIYDPNGTGLLQFTMPPATNLNGIILQWSSNLPFKTGPNDMRANLNVAPSAGNISINITCGV